MKNNVEGSGLKKGVDQLQYNKNQCMPTNKVKCDELLEENQIRQGICVLLRGRSLSISRQVKYNAKVVRDGSRVREVFQSILNNLVPSGPSFCTLCDKHFNRLGDLKRQKCIAEDKNQLKINKEQLSAISVSNDLRGLKV